MSKNNNVNPGQYKTAGRLRMGESLGQDKSKQRLKAAREDGSTARKASKKR